MQLSEQGAAFIAHGEGFVGQWYRDPVGVGTIGHGFTWSSGQFRVWWGKNRRVPFGPGATMTRQEAAHVLRILVDREYGAAVRERAPNLEQHEHDGASSVAFNAGAGSLGWTWFDALKRGDPADAARRLRTTAITGKGPDGVRKELRGLVIRRREEAELIQHGDYFYGAERAVVTDAMADGMLIRGERGPDVAKLIRDLTALRLYNGVQDDVFGVGTEAAVLKFQRLHGLAADGWAGPETLAAIAIAMRSKGAPATNTETPAPGAGKTWINRLLDFLSSLFRRT